MLACHAMPSAAYPSSDVSDITYVEAGNGVLLYRGQPIAGLAEGHRFTQVAYLLLYGDLPLPHELQSFERRLASASEPVPALQKWLSCLAPDTEPLAVLASALMLLPSHTASRSPEEDAVQVLAQGRNIVAWWLGHMRGRAGVELPGRDPFGLLQRVRHPHAASVVAAARAVLHRAVVPDHEIALAPLVAVDELRLRRECIQLLEQGAPFVERHADDVRGMRADVQRLAAACGDTYQSVLHRRHSTPHLLGDFLQSGAFTREPEKVFGLQGLDPCLRVIRQFLVDEARVDELGVATIRRNDMAEQQ